MFIDLPFKGAVRQGARNVAETATLPQLLNHYNYVGWEVLVDRNIPNQRGAALQTAKRLQANIELKSLSIPFGLNVSCLYHEDAEIHSGIHSFFCVHRKNIMVLDETFIQVCSTKSR